MSYSVIDLFINASFVVQLVIFLLLLASIFSWMVIFERWIFLNKSKEELVRFEDLFWSDAGLEAVFDQGEDENHVSIGAERIFRSGYQEYKNIKSQDLEPETVLEGAERAMRISLSREQTTLEKHLPFLATVASASPYVGLFAAIPALIAYNRYTTSVESLLSSFEDFMDEFSIVLHRDLYKK